MKHTLTFEFIPETPPITETVELDFPRFFQDTSGNTKITNYVDHTTSVKVAREFSFYPDPFQSIVLRMRTSKETDGEETVSFEVVRYKQEKASKCRSNYENGPMCHVPCDESEIQHFVDSFAEFLKNTLGDYLKN